MLGLSHDDLIDSFGFFLYRLLLNPLCWLFELFCWLLYLLCWLLDLFCLSFSHEDIEVSQLDTFDLLLGSVGGQVNTFGTEVADEARDALFI